MQRPKLAPFSGKMLGGFSGPEACLETKPVGGVLRRLSVLPRLVLSFNTKIQHLDVESHATLVIGHLRSMGVAPVLFVTDLAKRWVIFVGANR